MVKQYVGARYVPKFASPVEWASDTSYEALTIVTFNNASYTSKIPVPPTVGNPANNPKYWALTGNYNAQVEEYRQETVNVKNSINEEVSNRENADNILQQNIDTLKTHPRNFILIGDSFSIGVNGDDNTKKLDNGGWIKRFANTVSGYCNVYWYDRSAYEGIMGGGFGTSPNFLDTLKLIENNNPSMDKLSITDIIVLGGTNESTDNLNAIDTGISNFMNYAKPNYPNAKIGIGIIGSKGYYYVTTGIAEHYSHCTNYGAYYIDCAIYIYCQLSFIGKDGLHLTESGYDMTQQYVNNVILSNKSQMHYLVSSDITFNVKPAIHHASIYHNFTDSSETVSITYGTQPAIIAMEPVDSNPQIPYNRDVIIGEMANKDHVPLIALGSGKMFTIEAIGGVQISFDICPINWYIDADYKLHIVTPALNWEPKATWTQYITFNPISVNYPKTVI